MSKETEDAVHVAKEFFTRFPLKGPTTNPSDWKFFLDFLWLRGFKIVRTGEGE